MCLDTNKTSKVRTGKTKTASSSISTTVLAMFKKLSPVKKFTLKIVINCMYVFINTNDKYILINSVFTLYNMLEVKRSDERHC